MHEDGEEETDTTAEDIFATTIAVVLVIILGLMTRVGDASRGADSPRTATEAQMLREWTVFVALPEGQVYSGRLTDKDAEYDAEYSSDDLRQKLAGRPRVVDSYLMKWRKGETWRLNAVSDGADPTDKFDPFLILVSDGKVLDYDDDSGEGLASSLSWKVAQSGDYSVLVTSFRTGEFGAYRLSIDMGQISADSTPRTLTELKKLAVAIDPSLVERDGKRYVRFVVDLTDGTEDIAVPLNFLPFSGLTSVMAQGPMGQFSLEATSADCLHLTVSTVTRGTCS